MRRAAPSSRRLATVTSQRHQHPVLRAAIEKLEKSRSEGGKNVFLMSEFWLQITPRHSPELTLFRRQVGSVHDLSWLADSLPRRKVRRMRLFHLQVRGPPGVLVCVSLVFIAKVSRRASPIHISPRKPSTSSLQTLPLPPHLLRCATQTTLSTRSTTSCAARSPGTIFRAGLAGLRSFGRESRSSGRTSRGACRDSLLLGRLEGITAL